MVAPVAPNAKINFTKKTLESLPIPEQGKRFEFKDEKERGLIVRVMSSGAKSFQLYKKFQGRPVRITLGTFPDMSVENARKAAQEEKGKLAQGKNSNIEKNRFRQESTLKELFTEYMERYSKKNKKSWEHDEKEIPRFFGHWFGRRISTISRQDIQKLHEKIRDENGLYQANRSYERLRAMYNKAIEWGWEGFNPTQGIKKFKEVARDRFIQPSELPALLEALKIEENEIARDYIAMSLFTGARKTNVLQMKWQDIDLEQERWRIPETKNGEPQLVPLVSQALEILHRRKANKKGPWVFPSEVNDSHFADPKKAWLRVRQRGTITLWRQDSEIAPLISAVEGEWDYRLNVGDLYKNIQKEAEKQKVALPEGLMDIRLHDIRRTFGSYQAMNGASSQVIGKSLGHKSHEATQIYARLNDDPIKASMAKAANAMTDLMQGEKK